ncbi:MAG: hypothetical protein AB7O38_09035 [Pirellulaceae bacterium]
MCPQHGVAIRVGKIRQPDEAGWAERRLSDLTTMRGAREFPRQINFYGNPVPGEGDQIFVGREAGWH